MDIAPKWWSDIGSGSVCRDTSSDLVFCSGHVREEYTPLAKNVSSLSDGKLPPLPKAFKLTHYPKISRPQEPDSTAGTATAENVSPEQSSAARCGLCFHACLIPAGGAGYCRVRHYDGQKLTAPYLGKFCSAAVDPIEKKPLRHWRPGSFIYSLGSVGCNMRCPFCQNHTVAQPDFASGRLPHLAECSPRELAGKIRALGLDSVAFTYNEPTLQAEYILAAAPLLRDEGIAVVLVSNGMLSPAALPELVPWVAAANIDVKSFNSRVYAGMGGSLETVMDTVACLLEAGTHVEITCLLVPGLTDSRDEFAAMTEWIASISPDIPLHISRYFPANRFRTPATPIPLLQQFCGIAKARLSRVHIGNV